MLNEIVWMRPIALGLLLCICVSCESKSAKRVYDEIVLEHHLLVSGQDSADARALLQEMLKQGQDPHAFLNSSPTSNTQANLQPSNNMAITAENQTLLMASLGQAELEWKLPDTWQEKPKSGMRLASFKDKGPTDLDVSIVALSGEAGGLSSNINRWLSQLGSEPFSQIEFQKFLGEQKPMQTESGLPVQLIDLAQVKIQNTSAILAATISLPGQTLFIKMTGSPQTIEKNRQAFMDLVRSIKLRS